SLGKVLGEAAVRAAENVQNMPGARLRGAPNVVSWPRRRVEHRPTTRTEYRFNDADPVNIRLGLLMIGQVALAGVSGEVFTLIAQRLNRESPSNTPAMVH